MTEHNHKPNFGRYVAECPRCVEKHPDGPPPRKTRTASVPADDPMRELVRLQLEEREEKRQKEAEAKARVSENKAHLRARIMAENEAVRLRQERCTHTKENGRTAIAGQVHNDGLFHGFCFRCMKAFGPVRPTAEQLPMGVQVF